MVENVLPLANVVAAAVLLICYVAVLAAANAAAKGRARLLGVLGLAALALSTLLGAISGSLGPWLTFRYGDGVDFPALVTIAIGGLSAVGLVLLALAIRTARQAAHPAGGHR